MGHQPVLDGLRGLAFVLVFVGHAGWLPFLRASQTAMFLFFALSGFLITALLVEEHARNGRIRLGGFFARRALRLLPALIAFLAVWLLVVALFSGSGWLVSAPGSRVSPAHGLGPAQAARQAGVGLAYVANWADVHQNGHEPLSHLWSLSVEEQFYVLWAPLVLVVLALFAGRRSKEQGTARSALRGRVARTVLGGLAVALAAGSVAEACYRYFLVSVHQPRVTYGTDTRAGAFLLGGAIAIAWSTRALEWLHTRLRRHVPVPGLSAGMAKLAVVVTLVGMVLAGRLEGDAQGHVGKSVGFAAATVLAPLLIAALLAAPQGAVGRFLSSPVARYVGRRSYALYLWHYVMLTWFNRFGTLGDLVALAGSLAAAECSWRLVERPALSLKARFEPDARRSRVARREASERDPRGTAVKAESRLTSAAS